MLPNYIKKQLFNINLTESDLVRLGAFKVFAILRADNPSLNFIVLKSLCDYCQYKQPLQVLIKRFKSLAPTHQQLDYSVIDNFLNLAYNQAEIAINNQEIPVGCVIVKNNEILATAFNCNKNNIDIIAHAEILAIKTASKKLPIYNRLRGCDLYVTLEPCLMCAGAIIESRLKRLIFGCYRNNGLGSVSRNIFVLKKHNPYCEVIYVQHPPSRQLLLNSFKKIRAKGVDSDNIS